VTPAINISGALVPGSLTVSNSTKNYAFRGSGGLSVAGAFTKLGSGSLIVSNTSDNSFSSLVTISNGPATLSNSGQNTFFSGINIGGGSLTLSGSSSNVVIEPNIGSPGLTIGTGPTLNVANSGLNSFNGTQIQLDGTLAFNQPVDSTFDSVLINSGTLTKAGPAKLTVAGNNSIFSGPVQINGGTLIAGAAFCLGASSATIAGGAALDLNGRNLGSLAVTISGSGPAGAGSLVNNAGPQNTSLTALTTALHNVILAADSTLGGTGPVNTDPIQNLGYFVIADGLSSGSSPFVLTKVGQNQVTIINATVDPALGHIDVQQGMLNFQGATSSMGNPASNIIVRAGAILSFYDTSTPWDKNFVLFGNGLTPNIWNYNGTHSIVGSVTLNGSCVFGGAPLGRGVPVSITLNGRVTGTGGIIKSDIQNTLILAATNNDYAGSTTISNGTILVDGVSGTNFVLVAGGTLGGIGLVRGAVTVQADGTLSPGDTPATLATLAISNSLVLAGTNLMDVTRSGGVFTSDLLTNITSLSYGGVLQLNLTGESLAAGDSIKLYSFNSAASAFSAIVPETPGSGLKWDTTHLTSDGTLRVASLITTPPQMLASVSGNQLHLTWPADHTGWILQGQTNTTDSGLGTSWFEVPGSVSVNTMSFTLDPANHSVFYRLALP